MYLKPQEGDSPFYLHLTLDDENRRMRIYYHMSWWKNEVVTTDLFDHWQTQFKSMTNHADKFKHKERKKSYKINGTCSISCKLFKDIIGFVEQDVCERIPAKFEFYVNSENKIIELEFHISYQKLGSIPAEMKKLSVCTTNADYECVRPRLLFFDMKHIISNKKQVEKEGTFSIPLPIHHGSPNIIKETGKEIVHEQDFVLDSINTADGNPYTTEMKEEQQQQQK